MGLFPRLTTTVYGEDIIIRDLLRFSSRGLHAEPAFYAIGEDMMDEVEANFDTEGAHASGGWAPLAAATVKAKAAQNLDPRILHATLEMRRSLTEHDANNILIARSNELIFGTKDPKAGFHQRGTVDMPQRRPLEFTELAKRGFVKTLQRYIVEGDLGIGGVL